MFVKNFELLFMFTFIIFCDSAFVDNLSKCHLDDLECLKDLHKTVIQDIGEDGIPEFNIPPVDPIHLVDVTVTLLDIVNITMVDGFVKGIKDCTIENFSINIEEEVGHVENICDIIINGHYKIEPACPVSESSFGNNTFHGDGNGKVKIEKLHLKFDFPFYAQKREDGEIYIKCNYEQIKHEYEIKGQVEFFADNLYSGDEEVSKQVIDLLNESWRFFLSAFGQPFVDKAMEFSFRFSGYFFDNVPARYFIIEDLSSYAKP